MKIVKIKDKTAIELAVKSISEGGVVICPTDTVYGFLADAENKKAVEKIYKIKKRPKSKPLPIFVKDIKMAKCLAEISKAQEVVLKKYWPGKYTFILKSKKPIDIGSRSNTIALRIPKHKFLNSLLKKIDKPLAQTSVNISGRPPLNKIKDIIKCGESGFPQILIIDGGNLPKRNPSKIIDLTAGVLTKLR